MTTKKHEKRCATTCKKQPDHGKNRSSTQVIHVSGGGHLRGIQGAFGLKRGHSLLLALQARNVSSSYNCIRMPRIIGPKTQLAPTQGQAMFKTEGHSNCRPSWYIILGGTSTLFACPLPAVPGETTQTKRRDSLFRILPAHPSEATLSETNASNSLG